LKIADLQKGVILEINGVETVGEGVGFGVPVLVYSDETYFSGSSEIYLSQGPSRCLVVKKFNMDRIARNNFGNAKLVNGVARRFIDHLSNLYQRHRRLRLLALKDLTSRLRIGKIFLQAPSRGTVTVTYEIDKQQLLIKADFEDIKKQALQKIFILNEQGSKFFRTYTDSAGMTLTDEKIGAWDNVSCDWASLRTTRNGVGFRLWKREKSILRRGREFLEGSLDWAGLDYELGISQVRFGYTVDLLGL
jgi:hypothetical protein